MSRIARMPHVYTDKAKGRHFIEIRVPGHARAIIGGKPKRKHTFPKHVTKDEAEAQSVDILKGWDAEWAAVLPQPPRYWHHLGPITRGGTVRMLTGQLPWTFDDIARITRELAERQPSPAGPAFTFEPEPPAESISPAKRVTPYPDSVEDWGAKLGKGPTTIKRQLSKMERLFDFLAVRRRQPGFVDMNQVTPEDLIAYEDESLDAMVKAGTCKTKTKDDHVIQIRAAFAHARRRLHIDMDPSEGLRSYHRDDDGANVGDEDASRGEVQQDRGGGHNPPPCRRRCSSAR